MADTSKHYTVWAVLRGETLVQTITTASTKEDIEVEFSREEGFEVKALDECTSDQLATYHSWTESA